MNHVPRDKKIADRLKKREDEAVNSMTGSVFNYVNCTGGDFCKGWINLFFGDEIIALIDNVELANEIRKTISERKQNEKA